MKLTVEELNVVITAQNREFNEALNGVINRLDDMDERTRSYGDSAAGVFKKVAAAASAIGLGKIISDSIMNGGDLEQNLGGVEVVFDKYADSMRGKAETAFKDMGLSESDYLAMANKMGALFKGTGMDAASAAAMSQQAMQRAAGVASIMGLDTASAMEAVTGAAKGNFTMMDNLGVAINDTSLQIYAQEKGLGKLETTQQKVNAAMQMFFEKTEYAAGNYAKENETFSGSLSTFKAELDNLSADLGTTLLPTAISVITMARDGLEVISPLVIGLGEGINGVCQYINDLSPSAKTMLGITVLLAVAIPAATKAQLLYNAANGAWKSLLGILIPKEITRANVLKATVGWLAIIAGMLALVADVGATAREMSSGESEDMQDTADGADTASESVDGLAESYSGLGKSAETAKKSLADIDTLNIFDGGSASTGGIDFAAVTSGAENASDMVAGLTDELGGLTDELDVGLDGLGDTFSTTFGDIGTGFSTLFDAFNFDSDTQLSSLRVLNEKVKQLFGEDWTTFWNNVGSTMYQAFGEHGNEYARFQALTDIQNWLESINGFLTGWMGEFGQAWTEFWMEVGSEFYTLFKEDETQTGTKTLKSAAPDNASKDDIRSFREMMSQGGQRSGESGSQGGRIRGVDTSQYSYTDYSPPASSMSSYQSGSEIDWSKMGPRLPEEGQERCFNFEIHNYVEMDGNRVGESVTEYQTREAARSNGY